MSLLIDKNEQRNLQYECKLGMWTKTRYDISNDMDDAAEEARRIRIITKETLMKKEEQTQKFLKLTQERAKLLRKKEQNEKKDKISSKKTIVTQITSFEAARNQANKTKNLLTSRFTSP